MSTCGVLPAVTLHCMGEQEATAVASVTGSWQYSDLQQRGPNSVPTVLRCLNPQSDSLVPSAGMASQASSAKGLIVNPEQLTATPDMFSSSSSAGQQCIPQDSQLQTQGKSGWSSVVVLGSGLSVTAMAGAHMATYGSPSSLLDLLSSLGFSVDIRVLEASAFSLWHVSGGAERQMSLLIFFLMTALCAAAAATLKLSPSAPSSPPSSPSLSSSPSPSPTSAAALPASILRGESEHSSTAADAGEASSTGIAGERDEQGGAKVEATASSSGTSRSSAWFSFSFSSNSITPPVAVSPPSAPLHAIPEAVPAVSDTEADTNTSTTSTSSSTSGGGGGGFFPTSISLPGYWFPFSASSSTASAVQSAAQSPPQSPASSEGSVTSAPPLVPSPLAASPFALSPAPGNAFLRLDSEDNLSDVSCDDSEELDDDEVSSLRASPLVAQEDAFKTGLPLSRSLPSSLSLTLPSKTGLAISSSIGLGLGSASSSAWSSVAWWSQSIIKSPVSLSLGDSPAVLVRSLSQLFSAASRSVAALPTVFSESSIDEMSTSSDPSPQRLIQSDPAVLREHAKNQFRPCDQPLSLPLSLVRAADTRAVQAEVREATAAVGTRDLAALMLRLDWTFDDAQGPWEMIIEKQSSSVDYMTWRRDPQDGGVTEYRSRIRFIGASARDTCAFYTDCSYMHRWDPMLRSFDPLHVCPATGVQLARFERKYPFCSPREYVLAWRVWQQGVEGVPETFYCITKAVEDASVPRKNKPRRVDVYRSEWRMQDVVLPDGRIAAEMEMVVQEDSGMQRDMAKMAYRRGAWGYIRSTDSHLRAYIKDCIDPHRAKGPLPSSALVEEAWGPSPPRVLPPLSVVKQVPSHLIPEGAPDADFHARCQMTATAAPSIHLAAVAEVRKLHAVGTAALTSATADQEQTDESTVCEGAAGQMQQQQQQKRRRRFRPLAIVLHLLRPAATVAAVGLGGGLLVLSNPAVGAAVVLTARFLIVRTRAPSTIELTPRQQL